MGGGYLQLSAVGEQNAYLTGNPQITFFKSVYRRHTNFAIDMCAQTINGNADFGKKFNVIVNKYGDLLCNVYVDNLLTLANKGDFGANDYLAWTNGVGYAILEEYSVSIGQNLIDTQNGEWLDIYNKLSLEHDNNNAALSYRQLVSNTANQYVTLNETILSSPNYSALSGAIVASIGATGDNTTLKTRVITELKFWFCKYYGQALPLISLNDLDVTINFSYRKLRELVNTNVDGSVDTDKTKVQTTIWCEYIFLDGDERRRFNSDSHEYLIEQVQTIENVMLPTRKNCNVKLDLKNFTNCVKAIFWVPHMRQYTNSCPQNSIFTNIKYAEKMLSTSDSPEDYGNNWFNYSVFTDDFDVTNNTDDLYLFNCGQLLLNNEQRTPLLPAMYFANVQPRRYFDAVPFSNYIYTYSFALYPFEHQPSGTCNFSRFNTANLSLEEIKGNNIATGPIGYSEKSNYVNIYALSYNELLIHSGNAQLKYLA